MVANPASYDASSAVRPDVYDPATNPELFEGVMRRRILAFVIDVIVIAVPIAAATLCILVFGIFTFGLGLILLWPLHAGAVTWAVLYYGFTLGGSASATIGMRAVDLEMRTSYGAPSYFVLGAVHAIGYWLSFTLLTPAILLVGLVNDRHDIPCEPGV